MKISPPTNVRRTEILPQKYFISENFRKHRPLYLSVTISSFLLIILMAFEGAGWKFMDLEAKWMLIAGAPILLALFVGGYIKNVKGFGLELEAELNGHRLPESVIDKTDVILSVKTRKDSVVYLDQMEDVEKRKINSIQFIKGKRNYYDSYAVDEYLSMLPNVKYLEIINDKKEFLGVISAASFKKQNDPNNSDNIRNFIGYIEGEGEGLFSVVTDVVFIFDSLILAYKKLQSSNQTTALKREGALPVLNEKKEMIGVISMQSIKNKIVQSVAQAFI